MKKKLMELQGAIGYHFHDVTLLEHALSHSSYANEKRLGRAGSNERLEFLGDAVLELVSSEFFFKLYADKPEGDLTKIRASFVQSNFTSESISYWERERKPREEEVVRALSLMRLRP